MQPNAPLLLLTTLALAACSDVSANKSGDLSATKTGSIVTDLALRSAPDAEFLAECGDGALAADAETTLPRPPFLQQVTAESALVVFQTRRAEPSIVDVTLPDGAPVGSFSADLDAGSSDGSQRIAALTGLEPATHYCYSLRGATSAAGFRSAPAPGDGSVVRFVAFGDSGGGGSDQRALREQLGSVAFDLIAHTGDLAYNKGSAGQLDRTVFREYASLLRSFPLYPSVGNHDDATNRAAPYRSSFVLPDNGVTDAAERWYSFDWGDVHFVALDTEHIGDEQADWLDADLSKNRRPWTVVYGHAPPYSSGEHGGNHGFREHFGPVLQKYQVPLVLSGHDHDYERTKVIDGTTYVVTGGGGVGTRPVGSSSFTAFSESVIHFVLVEIEGGRLVLHAIDAKGREFDQTVIERLAN